MGLKQKIKKACKSAPAWVFRPHGPCILRFSLRLEIESDRDKISLDCFPSLRTINIYPMLFMKDHHHVSQNNNLGASPPLILGFHPSKRHAALIASHDQGSVVLAFTLVLLILKRFLWRVLLVISMFVVWILVDLLCFVVYHLRISCCLYAIMSSFLMASNVCLVSHHILYV